MAIEFLLVTYPEQRAVLADGAGVGFTNEVLMLPADEYLITLGGGGYQPPRQDIVLCGTSQIKPMVVPFAPTGAAAGVSTAAACAAPTAPTAPTAPSSDRATRAKQKNA